MVLTRLVVRFKRGARNTLRRDEFDPTTSADSVVFVVGANLGLLLALFVAAGVIFAVAGRSAAVVTLVLAVPVIVFISIISITWEVLRYMRANGRVLDSDEDGAQFASGNLLDVIYTLLSLTLAIVGALLAFRALAPLA